MPPHDAPMLEAVCRPMHCRILSGSTATSVAASWPACVASSMHGHTARHLILCVVCKFCRFGAYFRTLISSCLKRCSARLFITNACVAVDALFWCTGPADGGGAPGNACIPLKHALSRKLLLRLTIPFKTTPRWQAPSSRGILDLGSQKGFSGTIAYLLSCTARAFPRLIKRCPVQKDSRGISLQLLSLYSDMHLLSSRFSETPGALIHSSCHSGAHLSSSISLARVLTASTRHAFSSLRVATACMSSLFSVSRCEASAPGDGATSLQQTVLHISTVFPSCPGTQ